MLSIVLRVLTSPFRVVRRVVDLVQGDDMRQMYGVNPNGDVSDVERLTATGVAMNAAYVGGGTS